MLKLLTVLTILLPSPSAGWTVECEPYDPIPMYSEQNISVRLTMWPDDQEFLASLRPLVLQLQLSEDSSWAVTLLTHNITFDYKDIR